MLTLCTIAVGLVFSCRPNGYTGTAAVERDGRVYDCSVVMGEVSACSLPHTGLVVLSRGAGGKHVSCHADHGIVTRCDATGFNGDAVIRHP
jgi:hypothetical protein